MTNKSKVQSFLLGLSFIIAILFLLLDMTMTVGHAHEPGHEITYRDYLLEIPSYTLIILSIGIVNLISIFRKKPSETSIIWYGLQFTAVLIIVILAVYDFSFRYIFYIMAWLGIPLGITGWIVYIEYKWKYPNG
ncbi:hypothetical protein RJG79_08135 [Mycoplasmatota bacterium WC44]